ncbi:MAG: S-layer homology domain-containing protein [Clostridia bacterium]|nr:S-layer homology domain-containing protein [Clostridia bacterium]
MKKAIAGVLIAAVLSATSPSFAANGKPTIYIAGESTAQNYNPIAQYPQTGWGQVMADLLTDDIVIENRAIGARSSKKFDEEGRLDKIFEEIRPGDYLFIQFGMNDRVQSDPEKYISIDDYKKLLKDRYINETRKRGAIPVLLTTCAQLSWDSRKNEFPYTRVEYAEATREVAKETGCKFIDINKLMTDTFNDGMDKDEVFSLYLICEPYESSYYYSGTDDHTHFKEKGAKFVAELIISEFSECVPELVKYVKQKEELTDIYGHWAEKDILSAWENGLVGGVGDGRFAPDALVTRGEFLKMAMNAAGIPAHGYRKGECLEVTADDWCCHYLQGALDKGLIPIEMIGTETEREVRKLADATEEKEAVYADILDYTCGFKYKRAITREEMAVLAMNCFNYAVKTLDNKPEKIHDGGVMIDSEISSWCQSAVNEAYAYGLVTGSDDGRFYPNNKLTRAQAVMVINRIAEKLSDKQTTDQ